MSLGRRLLQALHDRVMLLVSRGVVSGVDDSKRMQELQVRLLAGEVLGPIERFQQWGRTATPTAGSEVVVVCLGGNRDHPIVISVDDRERRPKDVPEGEQRLWAGDGSSYLHLSAGTLTVVFADKVEVQSAALEATGNVEAAGDVADATSTMQAMRDVFNAHTHPGDSGGTTGPPSTPMA